MRVSHYLILAIFTLVITAPADAARDLLIQGDLPVEKAPKNAYRAELYRLLMEVTKSEFGDYEIQNYYDATASRRQAQLLSEGVRLNVHWASPGTPIANADVIEIPVDIQHGLLGYRVCLTTKHNATNWQNITDINSLSHLRIGQMDSWPDYEVYKHNRVPVVGTPSFDGMFEMLAANRYDCLALGAEEVSVIYRDKLHLVADLRIEDRLLIYYDFPVYMYVSKKAPQLAKRIKRGFDIIQANGQFDRLFAQYFAKDVAALHLNTRHLVCLMSPYVKGVQCENPRSMQVKLDRTLHSVN